MNSCLSHKLEASGSLSRQPSPTTTKNETKIKMCAAFYKAFMKPSSPQRALWGDNPCFTDKNTWQYAAGWEPESSLVWPALGTPPRRGDMGVAGRQMGQGAAQ